MHSSALHRIPPFPSWLGADRAPRFARSFEPQHWGVAEALVVDPDGRLVSLQAPVPDGVVAPDTDAHHEQKYG